MELDHTWPMDTENYVEARLMLEARSVMINPVIYSTVWYEAERMGVTFDKALWTIFSKGMRALVLERDADRADSEQGNIIPFPMR